MYLFKEKKYIIIFTLCLFLILCVFLSSLISNSILSNSTNINNQEARKVYRAYINNIEIGIIENKHSLISSINSLEKDIQASNNMDIIFDKYSVSFKEAELDGSSITPSSQLYDNIKNSLSFKVMSWSILIDNNKVVSLSSEDEAKAVINEVKNLFSPILENNEEVAIEYIEILENIEIEPSFVTRDSLITTEDAVKYLLKGTTEDKIYNVKKGDSLWTIARDNYMSVEEIIQANPTVNPAIIQIGDKINLIAPKPYLNVEVKYKHFYEASIPYSIKFKSDLNLSRNKSITEKEGKNGKKSVTSEIVMRNGLLISKEIISQEIISEPEVKIVIQGSKRLPEDNLAVAFLPANTGLLTSTFGTRWGRHHNGADFSVPVGTSVFAYSSGVISYSGWKSGYGNLVIIDHGDGLETYYAHNSKLLVKAGDKVSKQQKIALSGNTGRSTGPHVHFEIHKNGKVLDPLKYLKENK